MYVYIYMCTYVHTYMHMHVSIGPELCSASYLCHEIWWFPGHTWKRSHMLFGEVWTKSQLNHCLSFNVYHNLLEGTHGEKTTFEKGYSVQQNGIFNSACSLKTAIVHSINTHTHTHTHTKPRPGPGLSTYIYFARLCKNAGLTHFPDAFPPYILVYIGSTKELDFVEVKDYLTQTNGEVKLPKSQLHRHFLQPIQ